MGLTLTQQQAIAARGNVLVVAGAGTGKTTTLVERCLHCLLEEQPPASLDEILIVTFTEAAAAEMRQRIRARLEEERQRHQNDPRWQEQLALFETAHLGTLHSFCYQLVREHFYQLELDPQLAVMPEEEARLLAVETLDDLLQKHYAGRGRAAEAVQKLIQVQGRGSDRPIRELVRRLHDYSQTLPDPAGWFEAQLALFASPEPVVWRRWLAEAVADWCRSWLPRLKGNTSGNELAARCSEAVESLAQNRQGGDSAAAALQNLTQVKDSCPRGKKGAWLEPLKGFLDEATFLYSLMCAPGASSESSSSSFSSSASDPSSDSRTRTRTRTSEEGGATKPVIDPLAEDWDWVRLQMTTLLQLAREFSDAFTRAKRELGVVDFHDLEQYALQLLWDPKSNQPTETAQRWRKRLRFIFVDEYQDINAAQDKIIEALSRPGGEANRFLVGDVKQSIYRFRLADPHIFQGYVESWRGGAGGVIPLVENFRSREGILEFVNSLFSVLMRREVGGVQYDDQTMLRFGAPEERHELGSAADPVPCVELHLRRKGGSAEEQDGEASEAQAGIVEMEEADKEARLVALRLRELKAKPFNVWDEKAGSFRPVEWNDMAVLLRSPANKSESYAKEFARAGVPLLVERGGFYASLEISNLLSLLQLLDNPLQDLPVLAVLRSPLVGLTLDELAEIRLAAKGHFWTALVEWEEREHRSTLVPLTPTLSQRERGKGNQGTSESGTVGGEAGPSQTSDKQLCLQFLPSEGGGEPESPTCRKVSEFLQHFARWRRLARQVSLSRCLDAVLSETHYAEWLLTQPRGEQRHANVQRLVSLAQQFDAFQRQGLFRFLQFVQAQQLAETEPEVAAVSGENSVRLMSIHQSKGLEFPVVVLADLGKTFNEMDLRAEIILDEQYGLCPQVKPPHTGKRYPSLPYWIARKRQRREMLGEELRLLYVAMTRARDRLLLVGSILESRFDKLRRRDGELDADALVSARSCSDWIGMWFAAAPLSSPPGNARTTEPGAPGEERRDLGEAGGSGGVIGSLQWAFYDDTKLLEDVGPPAPEHDVESLVAEPEVLRQLEQRLNWRYSFISATQQPAKRSVSEIRRRAAQAQDEMAAEFEVKSEGRDPKAEARPKSEIRRPKVDLEVDTADSEEQAAHTARHVSHRLSAASIGTIHHTFLQLVSLHRVSNIAELKQEARRMEAEGALSTGGSLAA